MIVNTEIKNFIERKKDMNNKEIREAMKRKRIPQWKLGEMLGVSENTINRKLRKELPTDEKQKILDIIAKVG